MNSQYVTGFIPRIIDCSEYSHYKKGFLAVEHNRSFDNTRFRGDVYFDSSIWINDIDNGHSGYNEILIGVVDFILEKDEDDFEHHLHVQEEYQLETDRVRLLICCNKEVFYKIKEAQSNRSQVSISIKTNGWIASDSGNYACRCEVRSIEVFAHEVKKQSAFEEARQSYIKDFLSWRICGDHTNGQAYEICNELSKSFREEDTFNNRQEKLESIIDFFSSLRSYLQNRKSDLYERIRVESSYQTGLLFNEQVAKITDKREQAFLLKEYNHLWNMIDIYKIFEEGFEWMEEFPNLAEEYLKIDSVNSPTLNAILIDGLITADIARIAWKYQIENKITSEAILSLKKGEYDQKETTSLKEFITLLSMGITITMLGYITIGLFYWWLTSLITKGSEIGHYILFGALFSASTITWSLYSISERYSRKEKQNNEEEPKYFSILKDLCELHISSASMNSDLLIHLLYRLEELGIRMNSNIYRILEKNKCL